MGVTELKRKGRRNKAVANNRTATIKNLLRKPEVRNVDVEAIKAQFEANKKSGLTFYDMIEQVPSNIFGGAFCFFNRF